MRGELAEGGDYIGQETRRGVVIGIQREPGSRIPPIDKYRYHDILPEHYPKAILIDITTHYISANAFVIKQFFNKKGICQSVAGIGDPGYRSQDKIREDWRRLADSIGLCPDCAVIFDAKKLSAD